MTMGVKTLRKGDLTAKEDAGGSGTPFSRPVGERLGNFLPH